MDYGELLSASWRITWRHKYLWILGFFAAEGGGCNFSGSGWDVSGSDLEEIGLTEGGVAGGGTMERLAEFLADNWIFLAGLLGFILLLGLVLLVISVIATGGLVAGTGDAYAGRPGASLGTAWRRGLGAFWRIVGMWLLAGVAVLLALVALGALLAIPVILLFRGSGDFSWTHIALIAGAGLLFIAILIPAAIGAQILLSWALRSLVLDGTGVVASLGRGWYLLRRHPGTSIVVWLIATGIGIALGLAVAAAVVAAALPLGLLLLPALAQGGAGPGLLLVLGPLAFVVLLLALVLKAGMSTFFGAYWTVAYRKLEAGAAGTSAVGPAAAETPGGGPPPGGPPVTPP